VTLATDAWALSGSLVAAEQPARRADAAAARRRALLRMGDTFEVGPAPPAAAERLEQSGGVGEAAGLCLDERQPGLLVALLGIEHGEVAGIAVLILEPGQIERPPGGLGRGGGGFQGAGVLVEGGQAVGDLLEGGEDGGAILLRGLGVEGSGG